MQIQMNAVFLFIIGIPLVEIYLMIKVGGVIGAFNIILLIKNEASYATPDVLSPLLTT